MEAILGLALYLLPAIVAGSRRHHQATSIFLTNLFLGWTVIGWIAALIWSVSAVHSERRSALQQRQMARWEQAPLTDTTDPYMPASVRRFLQRRRGQEVTPSARRHPLPPPLPYEPYAVMAERARRAAEQRAASQHAPVDTDLPPPQPGEDWRITAERVARERQRKGGDAR